MHMHTLQYFVVVLRGNSRSNVQTCTTGLRILVPTFARLTPFQNLPGTRSLSSHMDMPLMAGMYSNFYCTEKLRMQAPTFHWIECSHWSLI